jgi:hypothetical protein
MGLPFPPHHHRPQSNEIPPLNEALLLLRESIRGLPDPDGTVGGSCISKAEMREAWAAFGCLGWQGLNDLAGFLEIARPGVSDKDSLLRLQILQELLKKWINAETIELRLEAIMNDVLSPLEKLRVPQLKQLARQCQERGLGDPVRMMDLANYGRRADLLAYLQEVLWYPGCALGIEA